MNEQPREIKDITEYPNGMNYNFADAIHPSNLSPEVKEQSEITHEDVPLEGGKYTVKKDTVLKFFGDNMWYKFTADTELQINENLEEGVSPFFGNTREAILPGGDKISFQIKGPSITDDKLIGKKKE